MNNALTSNVTLLVAVCALLASPAHAQSEATPDPPPAATSADATASGGSAAGKADNQSVAMAKKLANPIGALISVPFQNNFDFGGGESGEGFQYKLNFQPIVPISLDEEWNLLSRTIVPVVYQDEISGTSSQSGLSDTLQSFFLSPVKPTRGGWIWGAGPVLLLPTATDKLLGGKKWGAGPTAVVLKQQSGWTYGALANHLWSFAGASDRAAVNATFLQPFVSFTTKRATTFTVNTESTYDWDNEQWTVPLNLMVQQLVKIGSQPVAFVAGGRYYAEKPAEGPDWGVRLAVIFLFPKK